ncbi:toll-like receptor 2 [Mytilus galloprovincialis]|uniref:toll-like receptor 2 n=1 Tax=Mytilus galloprovincialis TaxID=29158 RepID=UPI003F7C2FEA
MNGTNLTYIDENGFDNLTKIILKRLFLTDNLISYIHPISLAKLKFLAKLYISNEPKLNVDVLKEALSFSAKQKLLRLIFEHNSWSHLPLDMFSNFTTNKVLQLRVTGNRIPDIKCHVFFPLNNMLELSLSNNLIENINITGIPSNLKRLHLDNNLLLTVPELCVHRQGDTIAVENLAYLDLSYNSIALIPDNAFVCLPKLKILILNKNPIGRIHNNMFLHNPLIFSVQLSNLGNFLKKIDDFAFNSSSLSRINLQQTNFHFDQENFNPKTIFSLSPNLTFLNLDQSYLPRTEIWMQQMFSSLINLKVLSLSSGKLKFLPKNVFPYLKSLEILWLDSNKFSTWHDGNAIFRNMTSLRKLHMANNFIRIINETSFPLEVLNSLEELDLSRNPYACTCDQLWFTEWIKATKVRMIRYPLFYRCRQPTNLDNVILQNYIESKMQCPPWNPLYSMAIVLSCTGFFLVTLIILGLKCQTNIKNYIYLWRVKYNRKKGYFPLTNADDFEYHAFVVYCDADRNWVHQTFLPKIEQDEGIKLCIHQRDFEVGESITANINKYLEKSWKVVVILSNEFAKSEWCQWEVDVVQERRRRYGRDVFLLIMLKTIDSKHMTNQLRALLDSASSLRYQTGVGEDLFWAASIETLRKPLEQIPTALL